MFRRQKILLALLEEFDGALPRTELQKLLFLFCEQSDDPVYEFVPYKFGCFSFQTYADKNKLTDKGFLVDDDRWQLTETVNPDKYRSVLDYKQRTVLWKLREIFDTVPRNELVRHVYKAHPYYAINSQIAAEILSDDELKRVEATRPSVAGNAIVSIGYEGLSLEGYLNSLIRLGVRMVCDVRKNPLSRKFGFSKTSLRNALEQMGIEYVHYPQLGIPRDMRRELNCQADYDTLFAKYEKQILCNQPEAVQEIADYLIQKQRVALLCYEKLPEQCHRTRVAQAVMKVQTCNAKLLEDVDEGTHINNG